MEREGWDRAEGQDRPRLRGALRKGGVGYRAGQGRAEQEDES